MLIEKKMSPRVEAGLQALYELDVALNEYSGDHQEAVYQEKLSASQKLYDELVELGAIQVGQSDDLAVDDFAGV